MTYRQSIWGLSNGVLVLALGGFAWVSLGLGLGPVTSTSGPVSLFPALAVLNLSLLVWLLLAGLRLRRKATGFRPSEVRHADADTQRETRRILLGLRTMLVAEATAIALVGFLCAYFQRADLAPAWVALVLGVHFLPLARLFGLRAYYATGLGGTVVAVIALAVFAGPLRMLVLGYGMGLVAWCSAAYLIWRGESIAQQLSGRASTARHTAP